MRVIAVYDTMKLTLTLQSDTMIHLDIYAIAFDVPSRLNTRDLDIYAIVFDVPSRL